MKTTVTNKVKVAALVSVALLLGAAVGTAPAQWRASGSGTGSGGGFFSGRGGKPMNPGVVEALFESYATSVLGCTVDATNPTRGVNLMAGGVSAEYSAAASAGMVSYKANLAGPAGHVGGACLAVAVAKSSTSTTLNGAQGYVATYELLSGQPMPGSVDQACALFDAVFGAQARYGLVFQQGRDGSWVISGSGNATGLPLEDGGTGAQAYKAKLSIVPYIASAGASAPATEQALVVHHTCLGAAGQWMY